MSDKRSNYTIEKVGIDYSERRAYKRAIKMLSGCLVCGEDGKTVDCAILDLSVGGAKIKVDQVPGDGEDINLRLGQRLKIAAAVDFPVEIVWQDGAFVGVRFLKDHYEVARTLEELLPAECLRFDDIEQVDEQLVLRFLKT